LNLKTNQYLQNSQAQELYVIAQDYSQQINGLNEQLASMESALDIDKAWKGHFFHIFPTLWPLNNNKIISGYGQRIDPMTGGDEFHPGLDIRAFKFTPVYAAGDGTVIDTEPNSEYGNQILIHHVAQLTTKYAHLAKIVVKKQQDVRQGQVIGYTGDTGRVTGPHLHFEIRNNGIVMDPNNYLPRSRKLK
jgi:murein DD-endopeptidase MepM/ murein hydrolase activator NlpD